MFVEVSVSLLVIFLLLYFRLRENYNYWKKKGVVYMEHKFPLGYLNDHFWGKHDVGTVNRNWYQKYHKEMGLKYVGAFRLLQPTLIVYDMDMAKHILTKDFNHFIDRDFTPTTHEPITRHLFSLEGKEWKDMRVKLTPAFTSGKIKIMFLLMKKCADQLQNYISTVASKEEEFQVKDLVIRFTNDIIATCAFGVDLNSFREKENDFYKTAQLIFLPKRSLFLLALMHKTFPRFSQFLRLDFFDRRISQVFTKIIVDNVAYRTKNGIVRNDFIDLLMKVSQNKFLEDGEENGLEESVRKEKLNLTMDEMVAQAFIFFAAGFETAASTTSFCLYELAMNPDVQRRLQGEIDEVLANHGGDISYQALQEMTYMDQVVNETLRRYASLPILTRVCTETYRFPGTDLVIDKGVRVNIPVYAFHHDPDIYPDPFRFDPDRFSEENNRGRHPYSFMAFGDGPRMCIGARIGAHFTLPALGAAMRVAAIAHFSFGNSLKTMDNIFGMRFGRLQVKIGLAAILSKFQLTPAHNTPSPLVIHPIMFFTTTKHPFSLRVKIRADV